MTHHIDPNDPSTWLTAHVKPSIPDRWHQAPPLRCSACGDPTPAGHVRHTHCTRSETC